MALKCFVQGCKSGWDSLRRKHKKENKKHPQIFGAPKHWTMLQIWSQIIPVSDQSFSITDKVCELHFTDDYLSKFHELTLNDGKKVKLERNYVKLLPGAIPTIFQNFPRYSKNVQKIVDKLHKEFPLHIPEMDVKLDEHMQSYLNEIVEARKKFLSNSEETVSEEEKSISDETTNASETFFSDDQSYTEDKNLNEIVFDMPEDSNVNTEHGDSQHDHIKVEVLADTEDKNVDDMEFDMPNSDNNVSTEHAHSEHEHIEAEEECEKETDEFTFDELVKNLTSVSKPNSSWSLTSHGKFVMCAKWNKQYQPEKRVVIEKDLNIKVYLNDTKIATYKDCISEIADISNILCILDK